VRLCAESEFSNAPNVAGVVAQVTLPCTKTDFKKREYFLKNGQDAKKGTTDAGYVYFATYAPGTPSQELEVGFEHNANLAFNGYSFYVRHGGMWNQDPTQANQCGGSYFMTVVLLYGTGGSPIIQAAYQSTVLVQGGWRNGFNYTFEPSPGATTTWTARVNPLNDDEGSPGFPSGKGDITPLTNAGWANGCSSCNVAMITAIAQEVPKFDANDQLVGSKPPTDPVPDGAKFGPVSWRYAFLIDGARVVKWNQQVKTSTLVWKPPVTITNTPPVIGAPPSYTVPKVELQCAASQAGTDRWSC
jgi:hypothetical protein